MNAAPAVSIVIVTYNSAGVIGSCLDALRRDGGAPADAEVIVVDNLSRDDTVSTLHENYPWVRVIENDENAGFSRAVNLGAEHAVGRYLLLLNPDARISAEGVARLSRLLDADPSIGAAAPVLENEGEDVVILAAGHEPSIAKMFLHQSGLSRLGRRWPVLEGHYLFAADLHGGVRDVDWVSGGCLMVPLRLWRRAGGLTDRWFMYAEDVEFCLRLRAAGLRVVIDAGERARHALGGSSSGVEGAVNTAWIVNLYDLYGWRMARNDLQQWLWRAVVLAGMYGRLGWFRIAARRRRGDAATAAQIRRFEIYAAALRGAAITKDREGFSRSL
ncbi:glycosyltransferase family 2 protein [uncultured Microbacterium sp.]|uniref:glycosyltransferase family 2 protein n=1 Tax=uncultured Microbacterium sp. TaxID=191216 RepID=UPI0025F0B9B4|nr:glycosyltransferase family 2 protein [uncultured Microbacterium sp.]